MRPEDMKDMELFSGLQAKDVAALSDRCHKQSFPMGSVILKANDPGAALYSVIEGEVRIFTNSPDGKEITFSTMGRGDFFGELSLIDDEPRSASAVAFEDTKLMVIHKKDFLEILRRHPEVGLKILRRLAMRLRSTDRHLETVAFFDRLGKVAWALMNLAEKGTSVADGIELPHVTHQDIANMIVSSRESVSRAMGYFSSKGWVESEKRRIILKDSDALRRLMR